MKQNFFLLQKLPFQQEWDFKELNTHLAMDLENQL